MEQQKAIAAVEEKTPNGEAQLPQIINLVLGVLSQAEALGARRVRMEPMGEVLSIEVTSPSKQAAGNSLLSKLNVRSDLAQPIFAALTDRSYFWPDAGDLLGETNNSRLRRILHAPRQSTGLLADLLFQTDPRTGSITLILDNLQRTGVNPLLDSPDFEPAVKDLLEFNCAKQCGLILANRSAEPHTIDGCAVVLALRPNALFYPRCDSLEVAASAIRQSDTDLVVVGIDGEDPIDLLTTFSSLIEGDGTLLERYASRLNTAYVHRLVSRSCSSCAKQLPVPKELVDKIPRIIRHSNELVHSTAGGCNRCNHSGIRGQVGIDSIIEIDSWLRKAVKNSSRAEALTEIARLRNYRCLLEDGLAKLNAGTVSCQALLQAVPTIPPHLAAALVHGPLGIYEPPNETVVRDLVASWGPPLPPPKHTGDKKPKLLVIEDNQHQMNILNMIFANAGYEVYQASNGRVAFEVLDRSSVDVIVCDLMMPEMNGEQFVRELRDKPEKQSIPVLMLTAVTETDAEYALLSRGADDYCDKNISRKVLLTRVDRLLAKQNAE